MGYLKKIYVDSSHRAKDGMCQCGYIYHCPVTNEQVAKSSEVFKAENNNDAEILGVYYALKAIYEKHNIVAFRVFNDNRIATAMLDKDKVITKKTLKEHPILEFVLSYFKEHGIVVKTERITRTHKMMKVCDKYSKKFRKERTCDINTI